MVLALAAVTMAVLWLIYWPPVQPRILYATRTDFLYSDTTAIAPTGDWMWRGQKFVTRPASVGGWTHVGGAQVFAETRQLSHLPRPRLDTTVNGLRRALMTVDTASEPDLTGHALLQKGVDYVVVGLVVEGRAAGMWEVRHPDGGVAYAGAAVFDTVAPPVLIEKPGPEPATDTPPPRGRKRGQEPAPQTPTAEPDPPAPPPVQSPPFLADAMFIARAKPEKHTFDSPGAPRIVRLTFECQVTDRRVRGEYLARCHLVDPAAPEVDRRAHNRAGEALKGYVLPEGSSLLDTWVRYTITMQNVSAEAAD